MAEAFGYDELWLIEEGQPPVSLGVVPPAAFTRVALPETLRARVAEGVTLAVTLDGAPLDPPLALTPLVDTVVMDRAAQQFLFVWRVTFPWEARFEAATLEVS